MIYHNLGVRFNSPIINLFIKSDEYLEFVKNFEYYSKCNIVKVYEEGISYPMNYVLNNVMFMIVKNILSEILEKIYYASSWSIISCVIVVTGIYIVIGILIETHFNEKKKKFIFFCLDVSIIVYATIILSITLLSRNVQVGREISLIPFSYLDSQDKIRGNLMNILLFYPLGVLSGTKWKKKRCILFGTFISLLIEMSQYFGNLGYAEVDDVINNTIGMALGVSVMLVFEKFYLHCYKDKKWCENE